MMAQALSLAFNSASRLCSSGMVSPRPSMSVIGWFNRPYRWIAPAACLAGRWLAKLSVRRVVRIKKIGLWLNKAGRLIGRISSR
jgi:hypothetical protein